MGDKAVPQFLVPYSLGCVVKALNCEQPSFTCVLLGPEDKCI